MKHPNLYILRHGETVWNLQGKFQGCQDSPLTSLGKAQAFQQKKILDEIHYKPKKMYSSPLGRARQTADIALGSNKELVIDARLQEIDFGEWEGSTREDIKSEIDYPFESGLWNFRSPGGESFNSITERVLSFLEEMTEPAIIVTHGTTSIVLRGICMGLNQDEILNLSKDQGCVYVVSNGLEIILR